MQQEKQNSLASRLEALDALPPGLTFNEQATWQQLELQLKGRRSRKIPLLVAALAVFIVPLLGSYFFQSSESPTVPVITKEALPTFQTSQPAQLTITKEMVPQLQTGKRKQSGISRKLPAQNDRVAVVPDIIPEQHALVVPGINAPADSMTKQVTVKALPRFRIAHINDLQNKASVFTEAPTAEKTVQVRKPLYATTIEIPIGDTKRPVLKRSLPIFQHSEQ